MKNNPNKPLCFNRVVFDKNKKDILGKQDKSKKGDIDEKIKDLCDLINLKKGYFTVSSCAGRIILISIPESNKKNLSEWIMTTHDLAVQKDFKEALGNYNKENKVFFKQEGAIIHICCRDIESAQKLIETARENGFKHSGIFSSNKKIIVELICSEHLSTPVFDKEILITDNYLKYLINSANKKLKRSWDCIDKLKKALNSF